MGTPKAAEGAVQELAKPLSIIYLANWRILTRSEQMSHPFTRRAGRRMWGGAACQPGLGVREGYEGEHPMASSPGTSGQPGHQARPQWVYEI